MKRIKLPLLVKVLIAIGLGILIGTWSPDWFVRAMNTFNGIFSQFLSFMVPLIIVGLIVPAIADLGSKATWLLLLTVGIAYASTVLAGIFGFEVADAIFPRLLHNNMMTADPATTPSFPAFFELAIPPLLDVMTALVVSVLLGLGIALMHANALKNCFDEFCGIMTKAIERALIPLLPIYIFGMFLNMRAVGSVGSMMVIFGKLIGIILAMTLVVLILQYCIAGIVTRRNPFRLLWNMLPAYATALGTSSSAATIPVTLRQTLKNGVSEEVAGFTVPLCATIHMSGSIVKITTCAMAIMLTQGMGYTTPMMIGFIFMLAVTMVAAPGVPGGCIMAALGILHSMLGFSPEQQALMITLYITMDSFGTACNVTGDGAIALIIDRISAKQKKN